MQVNLDNLVSMTEANQNFSKVAKLVDKNGTAVILKNNTPKYVVIEYSQLQKNAETDDQNVEDVAKQILAKHTVAFKELAK